MEHESGDYSNLQQDLSLCSPVTSVTDAWILLYYIKGPFSYIVEFNYPWTSPTFSVPNPLSVTCDAFLSADTPLDPLRTAIDLRYNASGHLTCFPYGGTSDSMSRPSSMAKAEYEVYPWIYITCSEVPLPHNGQGIFVFPDPYNFDAISKY